MNEEAQDSLDSTQRSAREQFSRQSRSYGRGHILADVADVREALDHISLPAKARVLDVATGGGHTGLYFAELGHEVTLADISVEMLKVAREAAVDRGLSVKTYQHPAEKFACEDGAFDLVTCRVAAHHFSSPQAFVRESLRALGPNGWWLLIDGTVADHESEAEAWAHEVEKLRDPSHARFVTPDGWVELCKVAGLKVTQRRVWTKKQPDLNWYFDTAATSPENRRRVLELVRNAPDAARHLFKICEEDGKIVWWWQMLTLIAQKTV